MIASFLTHLLAAIISWIVARFTKHPPPSPRLTLSRQVSFAYVKPEDPQKKKKNKKAKRKQKKEQIEVISIGEEQQDDPRQEDSEKDESEKDQI